MFLRRILPAFVLLATFASACDCGGPQTSLIGNLEVTIETPRDGAQVQRDDTVSFRAKTESRVGVQSMTLLVGEKEIAFCESETREETLECAGAFVPAEFLSELQRGRFTLTARAINARDTEAQTAISIRADHLVVTFVAPRLTEENPPVANVAATTAVELGVESFMPIAELKLLREDGLLIHEFSQPPYRADIRWVDHFGTGEHVVVARVKDTNGLVATAERTLRIGCRADTDCSAGTRCCVEKGTCNPIVGAGEDCDCERPCPEEQGCFPGTCGAAPRRCRPGCFPGTSGPGGVKADRCGAEDGRPAYCSYLPASERTAENKGGACAPADQCDVGRQDCSNLPLDRTRPVGPDNPALPQSCVPASPSTNKCVPAGGIPLNGTGCVHSVCTADYATTACQKGLLCVTSIDAQGRPIGQPTCRAQCTNPPPVIPSRRECPSGLLCYGGLQGAGGEPFNTGTCQ